MSVIIKCFHEQQDRLLCWNSKAMNFVFLEPTNKNEPAAYEHLGVWLCSYSNAKKLHKLTAYYSGKKARHVGMV